jgi:alpha-tubulin suppressor-like RCC1 family protein
VLCFSTDEGKILACGDNKSGQTVGGAGTAMNKFPQLVKYDGPSIVRIACGAEFSAVLDVSGAIW